MLRKVGFLFALMLTLPAIANAWTLAAKVSGAAGSIVGGTPEQTVTTGSKYLAATGDTSVTVTAADGYKVSLVTVDGAVVVDEKTVKDASGNPVRVNPMPDGGIIPIDEPVAPKTTRSVVAYFSPLTSTLTVTQSAGGTVVAQLMNAAETKALGSISRTSIKNLKVGTKVKITALPNADNKATTVAGTDFGGAALAGVPNSVIVTVSADVSYGATFTLVPTVKANLVVLSTDLKPIGQTITAGTTVKVDAGGSRANGAITYAWAGCGASGTASSVLIAPASNCTVTVTTTSGTASKDASLNFTVLTAQQAANGNCVACHENRDLGLIQAYNAGTHGTTATTCETCHTTEHAEWIHPVEGAGNGGYTQMVVQNAAGRDVAAGSDACLSCHFNVADWVNTPHTQKAKKGKENILGYNADPALYTRAAAWITTNKETYLHPGNKNADGSVKDPSKLGIRAVMTEKPTVTYSDQTFGVDDIAITIGSNYKQAYAVWMQGYGYKVLNIRYNSIGLTAEAMGERTDERVWEGSCIGCHLTGYDPTGLQASYKDTAAPYDLNPYIADLRIGCEACHGPKADGTKNPADLTQDQQIDICGRCHGNWNPTVPGTTARKDVHEFKPGDSLVYLLSPAYNGGVDRLMRPNWGTATKEFSTSGAAIDDHMQWYNFKIGKHYGKFFNGKPVTCTSCHDPHKNNPGRNYGRRILKGDYNYTTGVASICNECHPNAGYGVTKKGVAGALNPHTAKPYGVGLDTIPTDPTAKWPWE